MRPCSAESPLEWGVKASNRADAPSPTSSLRVLVVDDDPRVLEVLVEYLRMDGHETETAKNGREGLDRFFAGTFDLVVTDCAMPELFGDELAALIKAVAPATPVILLTGFGNLMRAAVERPARADIVISKPVRFNAFRETMAAVLAGRDN